MDLTPEQRLAIQRRLQDELRIEDEGWSNDPLAHVARDCAAKNGTREQVRALMLSDVAALGAFADEIRALWNRLLPPSGRGRGRGNLRGLADAAEPCRACALSLAVVMLNVARQFKGQFWIETAIHALTKRKSELRTLIRRLRADMLSLRQAETLAFLEGAPADAAREFIAAGAEAIEQIAPPVPQGANRAVASLEQILPWLDEAQQELAGRVRIPEVRPHWTRGRAPRRLRDTVIGVLRNGGWSEPDIAMLVVTDALTPAHAPAVLKAQRARQRKRRLR